MVSIEYVTPPPINATSQSEEDLQDLAWEVKDRELEPKFRANANNALKNTLWQRPYYLTKSLYRAALWVGKGNVWTSDMKERKRLITACFLKATELSGTTVSELREVPREHLLSNLQFIV